jgi:hypothetical protein
MMYFIGRFASLYYINGTDAHTRASPCRPGKRDALECGITCARESSLAPFNHWTVLDSRVDV